MAQEVTNVVVAGLGGQGVLKASDIIAEVVFKADFDVKKSEIHGMSQRGGSVSSDIRFGKNVLSPMVPAAQADYLVVISPDQIDANRSMLRPGGVLITADMIDIAKLSNKRSVNVALLGVLSKHFDISTETWLEAIHDNLPEKLHAVNDDAFEIGRKTDDAKKGDDKL